MRTFREVSAAFDKGRTLCASIRKVPSQSSKAGDWVDISMASGNPKPNYYASVPLEAATLDGMDGIYHGSGYDSYLAELGLTTPSAGFVSQLCLLDYLLYYPFVNLDSSETQTFDNTVTIPRYTDGKGVMVMVVAAAPTTNAGTFEFDYINQDGIERTSVVNTTGATAQAIATIVTSEVATASGGLPFARLANGDTGVRQILRWRQLTSAGGLAAVVLVKPLADMAIYELNVTAEKDFLTRPFYPPKVYDGAYLNFIAQTGSASLASAQLSGHARFIWDA